MIKNGGRLIARAVKRGKSERARLDHAAAGLLLFPPAFLLPAWHNIPEESEKTVARRRRSHSIQRQQACRHASTYAQPELARNHDAYTPDWLATDNSDASPTASTSKAVQIPSTTSNSVTELQSESTTEAVVEPEQVQVQSRPLPANDKGKSVDRTVDTPRTQAKRRQEVSTKPKTRIASALSAAKRYIEHEQSSLDVDIPPSSHEQVHFPLNLLPPSIRNILSQNLSTSSHRTTQDETSLLQPRFSQRYTHTCAILSACLHRSAKNKEPLSNSESKSVQTTLQQLDLLDEQSTKTLLDSLFAAKYAGSSNTSRIARIISDLLAVYILRQTDSSITQHPAEDPTGAPQHYYDPTQSDFVLKTLSRLARRVSSLSEPHRQAFVGCHLPSIAALIARLPLSHASTSAIAFQILDCCHVSQISDRHGSQISDSLRVMNPDEIMQALLALSLVVLQHALHPGKVAVTNLRLHAEHLEESLLRTWTHSVSPFLQMQYSDTSPPNNIASAISSVQKLACRAGMASLAVRVALDTGTVTSSSDGPKYLRILTEPQWQQIIRLCLRVGKTEEAEMLLAKVSASLDTNDGYQSRLWHSRLQVVLRTPSPDPSIFFDRLDGLLRSIGAADHKPDHHFLSTFLRHIPSFPTTLDRSCDLFHAALSLTRKTGIQSPSKDSQQAKLEALHVRLATSHSDIGLFERGKREAVQLPWSPLASASSKNFQSLDASSHPPSLSQVLVHITHDSQALRRAILQNRISDAKSAFTSLTDNFRMVVQVSDAESTSRPSIAAKYETARHLWIGSFVRLFSDCLKQQDWLAARDIVTESLEGVGSRFVGSQAIKRLLLAACSPTFHAQAFRTTTRQSQAIPPILGWSKLEEALSIVRNWAEDVNKCQSELCEPVVDIGMTVKQRFRSVVEAGHSTKTLARVAAMYLVSSRGVQQPGRDAVYGEQNGIADDLQVIDAFLSAMSTLQCDVNYSAWWRAVEKEIRTQLEAWEAITRRNMGAEMEWTGMKSLCDRYEQDRAASVASLCAAKIS